MQRVRNVGGNKRQATIEENETHGKEGNAHRYTSLGLASARELQQGLLLSFPPFLRQNSPEAHVDDLAERGEMLRQLHGPNIFRHHTAPDRSQNNRFWRAPFPLPRPSCLLLPMPRVIPTVMGGLSLIARAFPLRGLARYPLTRATLRREPILGMIRPSGRPRRSAVAPKAPWSLSGLLVPLLVSLVLDDAKSPPR